MDKKLKKSSFHSGKSLKKGGEKKLHCLLAISNQHGLKETIDQPGMNFQISHRLIDCRYPPSLWAFFKHDEMEFVHNTNNIVERLNRTIKEMIPHKNLKLTETAQSVRQILQENLVVFKQAEREKSLQKLPRKIRNTSKKSKEKPGAQNIIQQFD